MRGGAGLLKLLWRSDTQTETEMSRREVVD